MRILARSSVLVVVIAALVTACGGGGTGTGAYWSAPQPVSTNFLIVRVSCASAKFCLGLGSDAEGRLASSAWDGATWSSPTAGPAPVASAVTMLSCGSPMFCVAMNGSDSWAWTGQGWGPADLLPGAGPFGGPSVDSVSCASSKFCLAVTSKAAFLIYDGKSWSAPKPLPPTPAVPGVPAALGEPNSVSCASSHFCGAIANDGFAYQWNGHSWGQPEDALPPAVLHASCPSNNWCVFTSSRGYASVWNGHTWSGPKFVDPASMQLSQTAGAQTPVSWGKGDLGLLDLSCASTKFCVATDDAGYAVRFDGTTWSAPSSIAGPSNSLATVSCGSPNLCMAVVGPGRVTMARS